jgi:hypothetical protein
MLGSSEGVVEISGITAVAMGNLSALWVKKPGAEVRTMRLVDPLTHGR